MGSRKSVMHSLKNQTSSSSDTRKPRHTAFSEPPHQIPAATHEIDEHELGREPFCKSGGSTGSRRGRNVWLVCIIFQPLLARSFVSGLWGQATEFGALNGTVTAPVAHLIVDATFPATNTATNESRSAK